MNVLDSIKAHLPQNFYSELSTIFHELSVRHDEWTSLRKALCILFGRGKGSYDLFHPSLQQPSETIETNTVRVLEALHLVSTQLQQQNPYACQELLKLIKEIEPQSAISGKEVEMEIMECTTPVDMAFLQELDKSAENILESTGLAIDSSSGLHRDISDLLFPQDLRLREVEGILDYSRPVSIKLPENAQNMTEQDLLASQQTFLMTAANRALSSPVGGALFNFGASQPAPESQVNICGFELGGKINSTTLVPFDPNVLGQEFMAWPEFHSGVMAGLQVPANCQSVDGSWIIFNRPNEPTAKHAGFLYGLGLNGYFTRVNTYHWFEYLNLKHDMSAIGILLGLATSYCGSMNETVAKLISIHVPAFLPPQSSELNLSSAVQTAALLGMGILYCETAHSQTSLVLLEEIGRRDLLVSDSNTAFREGYSLAAGFSLGLINVGKGSSSSFASLIDRLSVYINGGSANNNLSSHALPNSLNRFKDSPFVNTQITAAPACIALGLVFLKSGNSAVASILRLPDSPALLEDIRPDLVLLRQTCFCLVTWESVGRECEWVESQLPSDLRKSQSYYAIIAGCCFAMSLKYAGTNDSTALSTLLSYFDQFQLAQKASGKCSKTHQDKLIKSVLRSGSNLLGCCCAIVGAGSGDLRVLKRLCKLRSRIGLDIGYGDHMAIGMAVGLLFLGRAKQSLASSNRSLAFLLCAFYPSFPVTVVDNRTHLQAFRHLWALAVENRCIVTADRDTGHICSVPIQVKLNDGQQLDLNTPHTVPHWQSIQSIRVVSDRYFCTDLRIVQSRAQRGVDYHLFKLRRRLGNSDSYNMTSCTNDLLPVDPDLLLFSKYFCSTNDDDDDEDFSEFCSFAVRCAASRGSLDIIWMLLEIYRRARVENVADEGLKNIQRYLLKNTMEDYQLQERVLSILSNCSQNKQP